MLSIYLFYNLNSLECQTYMCFSSHSIKAGVTWDFSPPPPPWISFPPDTIPYGKSSPSMGFLPPPPKNKNVFPKMEFVLRRFAIEGEGLPYGIISPWGSSAMGFLPGGGGGGAIWYYFPLLWDLFRGKGCHMVFLHGECLQYGIISGGTICHGICSLIMKSVWGEALLYGIVSHLWEVLPWDFFRGKV